MNFFRFGFVALFLSMSGCPAAELKTDTYYVEPEPEPSMVPSRPPKPDSQPDADDQVQPEDRERVNQYVLVKEIGRGT